MLQKAFGESAVSKTRAYEWYKDFKTGRKMRVFGCIGVLISQKPFLGIGRSFSDKDQVLKEEIQLFRTKNKKKKKSDFGLTCTKASG
ncbi:unnamed protein product [Acanthoscelides obtectus]|uniref:Mos1 transposase HTH domain-containing protein n=1 Tax=Acanthoscelides obtectus TaxID=200917 RepID=A0A9P0Q4A1_ACAOB|nr:unnamed protein product [Acanthoscelides obtectus]CAK1647571.1 hypothetical protein AOBTE_LOCUS15272 [Acanthoscelides obtectus]